MKIHLIDTHLLVPKSRSFAKVKVGQYEGYIKKIEKMAVSVPLVLNNLFVCLFPFIYRHYRLPISATPPEDG